jgi:hypothetical protein
MPFHLNNPFDAMAVILAIVACVRAHDRTRAGNVTAGLPLIASIVGQLVHHRGADRERAEARGAGRV